MTYPLGALTLLQEIPDPGTLESPLPGGMASLVRFFLNFPQPLQIAGAVLAGLVAITVAVIVWRRRVGVWGWLTTRPRFVYAWMAGLGVVAALGAGTVGFMGMQYVEHDNGFCTGCHVMGPAFVRFTESEHSQLECHDCHRQPMTASLRQLYLWVVERPEEIGPHAPVPTAVCSECHVQEDPGERWQAIAATQGHDTHLTSSAAELVDVQCVTCHAPEVHRFAPAQQTCAQSGCHEAAETSVALGAMSGEQSVLHCVTCHEFTAAADASGGAGDPALTPGPDACGSCHAMAPLVADISPEGDPHQAVCGMCHNPHEQEAPAEAFETCASAACHVDPAALTPFHRGLDAGVLGSCETCHSAHEWVVDGNDCRGCHTSLTG